MDSDLELSPDLADRYENEFDKILCDVPCFTDRHSLFQEDGNLFRSHVAKERLQMPELQANLLL